jgi:hypothetical protein
MEKERCHGCDKCFAQIEHHLTYHNHCQSVTVEHACQQRLKCRNRNNGMDPLIGTTVVASTPEVDDGMSTGMSTRGAKRQQRIEQEDNNQSTSIPLQRGCWLCGKAHRTHIPEGCNSTLSINSNQMNAA